MFSVILLPLPVCSRDVTSRLSVSYWVTQMPISPCSGMCILIYHENGGRFNASFQEDRASISSQANQKSAGYHCILAVFFHYCYGGYFFIFETLTSRFITRLRTVKRIEHFSFIRKCVYVGAHISIQFY